jgi:hypothetical protein
MPLQHAVGRYQAHAFDLALRKQYPVERIVGIRLFD